MERRSCATAAALLLLTLAVPAAAANYLLYSPRALNPEERGSFKEGVLVREIEVRKGETLSGISRRFSGRGSYYPQILLFNDIRNPNLIYSGATLKVPVTRGEAAVTQTATTPQAGVPNPDAETHPAAIPGEEVSPSKLEPASNDKNDLRSKTGQKKTRHKQRPPATTKAGRKLFNRALASYRREECNKALVLFDRFLSENPSSPLAAAASLYKADCYLKLSTR